MPRFLRRALVTGFATLAFALSALTPSLVAGQVRPVIVFAAASLAGALDEVADAFAERAGEVVTISYGGTSSLARHIEQGAPADIFISADAVWMNYLSERNLIVLESRTNLLGNRLVLVAPAGAGPRSGSDIVGAIRRTIGPGSLLAMADVDGVPAGRYGKTALETLRVWEEIARFVAQTDNVRTALAFVARGEAPLGVVYATDAAAEAAVAVVATFDRELHPPIVYLAAITVGSDDPRILAFFDFLTDPAVDDIFARHGFVGRELLAD